ncbi:MAG: AAA family ATPase [Candidatus Micrarchaeota archaeon]|nr:AAA family ATPase [Candidatus Micrarchaeota archaeon]
MEERIFSRILEDSRARIMAAAAFPHRRYLYRTLAGVPKEYFAGVCGLRGIGKSVLLLQLASEAKDSLYLSADSAYLKGEDLYETIRFCAARGYKSLFIDEIHYSDEWQSALKTAYDEGLARIFFSGSSALEIGKGADLSRRALVYKMLPLSFREHLTIKRGFPEAQPLAPRQLFDPKKRERAYLENTKASAFLGDYFAFGGTAYPAQEKAYFHKSLENTVEKILQSDLARTREIGAASIEDAKRMLHFIALSPAGELSYSSLASKVSVSKPTVMRVLSDLERLGMVLRTLPCGKSSVRKEPKLYLAFPFRSFFCDSLLSQPDIGALREEFFVNHAYPETCYLQGARGQKTPDFMLDGKSVEVGGAGKGAYQMPDFIMKEGGEFTGKSIPLFLAGYLY